MEIDNKLILESSKTLNVLYVEDDEILRNSTQKIFSNYFKGVDTAVDGEDGLKKFNKYKSDNGVYYDLVISDISMPNKNGIDMSRAIMDINSGQAIIFITAHNEATFLLDAIKIGVNGFLTKPLDPEQLKLLLYKTTQAISDRKIIENFYEQVEDLNMKLQEQNRQIQEDKEKLEEQVRLLNIQVHATNTKHQQLEKLLQHKKPEVSETIIDEYFAKDEDEGSENVTFMKDDCDEMSEIFDEITQLLINYGINHDVDCLQQIPEYLNKASIILSHYAPFLDPLSRSFEELASAISNNMDEFIKVLHEDSDSIMMLYDAVGIDMKRYMERFSTESMAMKNIHHIHHPTTLSITQIIASISPDDIDEGEIEFF